MTVQVTFSVFHAGAELHRKAVFCSALCQAKSISSNVNSKLDDFKKAGRVQARPSGYYFRS